MPPRPPQPPPLLPSLRRRRRRVDYLFIGDNWSPLTWHPRDCCGCDHPTGTSCPPVVYLPPGLTGADLADLRRGPPPVKPVRTHCWRGHALAGLGSYLDSEGRRRCVECRRIDWQAYRQRQAAGG